MAPDGLRAVQLPLLSHQMIRHGIGERPNVQEYGVYRRALRVFACLRSTWRMFPAASGLRAHLRIRSSLRRARGVIRWRR